MRKSFTWRAVWILLATLSAVALNGCGGGGGSSSSSPSTTISYTVGGTITGLSSNESVVLLINGGDALSITTNGPFVFSMPQPAGSLYQITVKSHTLGIACVISNGSGTVSSNVTGITVTCGTAGKEITLYSFGPTPYGVQPNASLTIDNSGDLFGTTDGGGPYDCGMVFKLDSTGGETVPHSFCSTASDGNGPSPGLIMDSKGNLYGTTTAGGEYLTGMVFMINSTGSLTALHDFGSTNTDGRLPQAGLIMDSAGNLYGTTSNGGAYGFGTVFKISPTLAETILHSFDGTSSDGQLPVAGLIMDSSGNLYGTTSAGGANGLGTVFKISPTGTETILHSFSAGTDGEYPKTGLVVDSAGNLYGASAGGGAFSKGMVYELSPSGTETVLYSFGSVGTDGAHPNGGLIMDSAGNLYGTTSGGGEFSDGTVFEISSAGTETILYSFGSTATDGRMPSLGRLAMDGNGNLYGTTGFGGTYNQGTVFEIIN